MLSAEISAQYRDTRAPAERYRADSRRDGGVGLAVGYEVLGGDHCIFLNSRRSHIRHCRYWMPSLKGGPTAPFALAGTDNPKLSRKHSAARIT